jgi:Flp pilus assembly protein protease CpaA
MNDDGRFNNYTLYGVFLSDTELRNMKVPNWVFILILAISVYIIYLELHK